MNSSYSQREVFFDDSVLHLIHQGLQTDRTILKPFQSEDLDHLYALYSNPSTMKYLGGGKTREATQALLEEYVRLVSLSKPAPLAIWSKDGQFMGRTGLRQSSLRESIELHQLNGNYNRYFLPEITQLGYVIHPEFQRKGIATEVALAVLKWGLDVMCIPQIAALIHPDNYGSVRVARDKCGMKLQGCFIWKDGLPWQFYSTTDL